MLDGVVIPVQQMAYSLLYFLVEMLWGINQAILLVGYYVLSITSWLSQQMFQPLLTSIGNSTDSLLLPVFTLAMLTLGITYLLGAFGVFRIVEFKSAVMWCLVAIMWFQFGPEMYLSFENFRRGLSGGFYGTVFNDLVASSGTIEGMGQIGSGGAMQIDPPTNNFGPFLSFDTSIDGLDIALAYLDATGCDVLRTAGCPYQVMPDLTAGSMPHEWYRVGETLEISNHSYFFGGMTQDERQSSLDAVARSVWIALSGLVVSLFGLLEQIIQLLLTIAFGIAFASFFIAILFAFFKRTESVTWAVFDIILGLFVQSIITALLLALVLAFVSVAGATGNGILLLGVGFLGIILIVILLIGAAQAILGALNGMMGALGQATGGNLDAGGTVTQAIGAAATGGATLATGGTLAQAAGATFGPGAAQPAYYASRAFGGDDTRLGRMANQVAQGASASYAGPLGGAALGISKRRANREQVSDLTLGTPITAVERSYNSVESLSPTRFPSISGLAHEGQDTRVDVATQQPYAFRVQDNGDGVRTYEDGSRVYTDDNDVPTHRRRAQDERDASRRFDQRVAEDTVSDAGIALSDTSIAAIDATDDDENASLLTLLQASTDPSADDRAEFRAIPPDDSRTRGNIALSSLELPASQGDASDNREEGTQTALPIVNESRAPVPDMSTPADPSPTTSTATDNRSGLTPSESFVLDVELNNPGSTGRDDLVAQIYPDGLLANQGVPEARGADDPPPPPSLDDLIPPPDYANSTPQFQDMPAPIVAPADAPRPSRVDDPVTQVNQVAEATQTRLAGADITTAGQLANATPQDLQAVGIGEKRAGFLINQAQDYVNPPAPSADQMAAAGDAVNNDDAVRLSNSMGAAMRSAISAGGTSSSMQAAQFVSQAGLPATPEATQFVQVASAMGLNDQQAQTIVQDVQNTNALGTDIAQSVRTSLANLTLANGAQLNTTGIAQAVSLLEGAARSLVTASSAISGGGAGSSPDDRATAGSAQPQPTASSQQ